jgi:hypothetical protein
MSALENHVDDYLRLRRTLGYDLEETGRLLHRFATELDAAGVTHITTQVAVRWALAVKVSAPSSVPATREPAFMCPRASRRRRRPTSFARISRMSPLRRRPRRGWRSLSRPCRAEEDQTGAVSGLLAGHSLSYSSWRRSQSCHPLSSSRPFGARSRNP